MSKQIKDGPNWSPDGGYFWAKDDILYWWDGDITDVKNGCWLRLGFGPYNCEDFSQWTDEQRKLALIEKQKRIDEYDEERQCKKQS